MKHTQYSEEALRRYLMGELPATEQVALETEYFGDRELYEQICELENDLIDDYVQGRMAPADREQFERHYLTIPEKHQQVEFARAMRRSLPRTASTSSAEPSKLVEAPSESRSWWSSLLAPPGSFKLAFGFSLTLAAVLAIGGVWLLMETMRLRHELAEARKRTEALGRREQELERQIALDRTQSAQLIAELERIRDQLRIAEEMQSQQHSTPAVVTLLLSGGLFREGNEQKTLRVPPNAEIVQIQLKLKSSDFSNYQAAVNTAEGKHVWTRKQIKASGTTVFLRIPARLFPKGDYILTLSGISASGEAEDISKSYFRIDKQ